MDRDRIVSEFRQRKLRIDFVELVLRQNKPSGAIEYKGKGYIEQTADDALAFKLYVDETVNTDLVRHFNEAHRERAGELYLEDSYYKLTGVDFGGTPWVAENVLPVCDWNFNYPNPIVKGNLSAVRAGELVSNAQMLTIHYFDKVDLEIYDTRRAFRVADCEFKFEVSDADFIVRVNSDVPIPKHFEIRVGEALLFLLARSLSPRVIVQPRCVELLSSTLMSPNVRLGPPICRGRTVILDRAWSLFAAYLNFAVQNAKLENWNRCSGYLHLAQEASANSLEAWAVGLSVAVEGLASLIEIQWNKTGGRAREKEESRLRAVGDMIVKEVGRRKRFVQYTERIRGMVAGLPQVRAVDRMKWLASCGGTSVVHISAWQKVRNRGVHPTLKGDVDVASLDFQKMIDQLHQVTMLLYHITFHLIRYEGPCTDYAVRGFPEGFYPPPLESQSRDLESGK